MKLKNKNNIFLFSQTGKAAGAKEGKQSLICAINWLKNPHDGRTRIKKFFKKRRELINEGVDKKEGE